MTNRSHDAVEASAAAEDTLLRRIAAQPVITGGMEQFLPEHERSLLRALKTAITEGEARGLLMAAHRAAYEAASVEAFRVQREAADIRRKLTPEQMRGFVFGGAAPAVMASLMDMGLIVERDPKRAPWRFATTPFGDRVMALLERDRDEGRLRSFGPEGTDV